MAQLHELQIAEEIQTASQEGRPHDVRRLANTLKLPHYHTLFFLSVAHKHQANSRMNIAFMPNVSRKDRIVTAVKACGSLGRSVGERTFAQLLARREQHRVRRLR